MDVASFMIGNWGIIFALVALGLTAIWLIFPFVALKRLHQIREEVESGNRYLADLWNRSALGVEVEQRPSVRVAPVARVIPTARVVPSARIQPSTGVIPPPSVVPLKISKSGQKLALKDTSSIEVMLKKGELTLEDRYFDAESNQWIELCCHPEFSDK